MTNLIYVQPNGVRLDVEAPDGMTVMQAAVEGIIGACAGSCRVRCSRTSSRS